MGFWPDLWVSLCLLAWKIGSVVASDRSLIELVSGFNMVRQVVFAKHCLPTESLVKHDCHIMLCFHPRFWHFVKIVRVKVGIIGELHI